MQHVETFSLCYEKYMYLYVNVKYKLHDPRSKNCFAVHRHLHFTGCEVTNIALLFYTFLKRPSSQLSNHNIQKQFIALLGHMKRNLWFWGKIATKLPIFESFQVRGTAQKAHFTNFMDFAFTHLTIIEKAMNISFVERSESAIVTHVMVFCAIWFSWEFDFCYFTACLSFRITFEKLGKHSLTSVPHLILSF